MFRHLFPLLLLLSACQPTPASNAAPTAIPFPTATIGRTIQGALPLGAVDGSLPNAATAVAFANQPTATPDWSAPTLSDTTLSAKPDTGRAVLDEIVRYLSDGGSAARLEAGLRDNWEMLGESGFVRADLDLTGEGVSDVMVAYTAPEESGNLLILVCADGRYSSRYQAIGTTATPPELLDTADLNFDQLPDILLVNRDCLDEDTCSYQTQMVTWKPDLGRFANLLSSTIDSPQTPEPRDIDNDNVQELIVRLDDDGNATTGPLRTGVNIYDWNGALYVLSIIQLDPPRFKIQVVHEADRAFANRDMEKAVTLYTSAFNDVNLRAWYNDDPVVLQGYIAYRLLLSYAYTEDDRLFDHFQTIVQAYPDPAARPIYAAMSDTFWNALQVTNNLHSACLEVLDVVNQQPVALELINRYGERSPIYAAPDLCPF